MAYPRNLQLVNGVLSRYCRDCNTWKEANAENFNTKGLKWDTYCRPCKNLRNKIRRGSMRAMDQAMLDQVDRYRQLTEQERRRVNMDWAKRTMRRLELTKEQVKAYFANE